MNPTLAQAAFEIERLEAVVSTDPAASVRHHQAATELLIASFDPHDPVFTDLAGRLIAIGLTRWAAELLEEAGGTRDDDRRWPVYRRARKLITDALDAHRAVFSRESNTALRATHAATIEGIDLAIGAPLA